MGEQTGIGGLPDAIANADNLPSPPSIALEVLCLANDENAAIEDLTRVISVDPALAARMVKLANSSMFRRSADLTSLERAIVHLGTKTVKLMALSFSLTEDLPRPGQAGGFDYYAYWNHSLTMAIAGRCLARLVRSRHADEAFLCGLLSRLGQLAMVQSTPGQYAQVLGRTEKDLPTAATELAVFGYDFHEVGSALFRSWQLPDRICQTIRFWGDPRRIPEETDEATHHLAHVVHLAGHATDVICGADKGHALAELQALAPELLGLSRDEIDSAIVSMESDVAELAKMLDLQIGVESFHDIVDQARMEMVQISLGTTADLQQTASRAEALEKKNQELEDQAHTDKLTGIPNRAHFDRALGRVVAARLVGDSDNALGLLMLDVDHFKGFNDTYGHQVGDEVLKLVAKCLASATRDTDLAARYGGEEFVVLLPNTRLEDLLGVAERVRRRVAATSLQHLGESLSVTISVGGACIERIQARDDGTALLSRADECLYEAKRAGRNRSVCLQVEDVKAPARA